MEINLYPVFDMTVYRNRLAFVNTRVVSLDASFSCNSIQLISDTRHFGISRICCGSILSLVQILFPLFPTHYHQMTITKTKEMKLEPRIKLNHNIFTRLALVSTAENDLGNYVT